MGFFDDDEFEELLKESNKFKPQELNEGNVQAIFNRCLANKDTRNISRAQLFLINMGYQGKEDVPIHFDKDSLIKNKLNIEYLYGQLNSVHAGTHYKENLSISDFNRDYTGNIWSQNKAILLELLYLATTSDVPIIVPFSKQNNDTTRISRTIRPTLSPKDPNFPAWWEEHKSEWEGPKKEGKEPSDD